MTFWDWKKICYQRPIDNEKREGSQILLLYS